jgi:hypothetical protein
MRPRGIFAGADLLARRGVERDVHDGFEFYGSILARGRTEFPLR